jgi:S1-C subfamily serine protease
MSGVGVVAEGCGLTATLASGVVVDLPGRVVTVAHAIAGATSVSVVDHNDDVHPAIVRAFDKDRDLAVLDVPGLDVPALDRSEGGIGPGGTLIWSRENGVVHDDVDVTKRLAVTIEDIYVEETTQRQAIEVHGDISVGDSGGAVLTPTGEVMGIIYARSRGRNGVGFATASSELDELLRTVPGSPVANGRCG